MHLQISKYIYEVDLPSTTLQSIIVCMKNIFVGVVISPLYVYVTRQQHRHIWICCGYTVACAYPVTLRKCVSGVGRQGSKIIL